MAPVLSKPVCRRKFAAASRHDPLTSGARYLRRTGNLPICARTLRQESSRPALFSACRRHADKEDIVARSACRPFIAQSDAGPFQSTALVHYAHLRLAVGDRHAFIMRDRKQRFRSAMPVIRCSASINSLLMRSIQDERLLCAENLRSGSFVTRSSCIARPDAGCLPCAAGRESATEARFRRRGGAPGLSCRSPVDPGARHFVELPRRYPAPFIVYRKSLALLRAQTFISHEVRCRPCRAARHAAISCRCRRRTHPLREGSPRMLRELNMNRRSRDSVEPERCVPRYAVGLATR